MNQYITKKEMVKIDRQIRIPTLKINLVDVIQEIYRYELRPITESKYFKDAYFFCRTYGDAYELAQEQANITEQDWTIYDSRGQNWTTVEQEEEVQEEEVQYVAAG